MNFSNIYQYLSLLNRTWDACIQWNDRQRFKGRCQSTSMMLVLLLIENLHQRHEHLQIHLHTLIIISLYIYIYIYYGYIICSYVRTHLILLISHSQTGQRCWTVPPAGWLHSFALSSDCCGFAGLPASFTAACDAARLCQESWGLPYAQGDVSIVRNSNKHNGRLINPPVFDGKSPWIYPSVDLFMGKPMDLP